MAKEENKKEIKEVTVHQNVSARNITVEMKESYLDYAMSVITQRALPDVRDGLKPVHRRILFAMHQMGLTAGAKTRKSAAVVGEVLGNFHPHGDASVYDAMVKMAQDFSYRYPLIVGQGNFGNVDGDNAAAMRYTEAKMSKVSAELLKDLEKETVEWSPNYDNTRKEPEVMPAALPNLLLNGTLGIAVGMATNIPPHNLKEVVDATVHLIDNKEATTEDLLQFIKGPDFPTGGVAYNQTDINHAYSTGRGGVVVRGVAEIVEDKKGAFQIIITSIPYRVNKAELIMAIADLVREKKVEGIRGLRDESAKDIRIVIDLKNGAQPQKVLNFIYKHTQLEDAFHYNLVALVKGVPQTLSLKSFLDEFIDHRKVVVKRRTEFDLRKAEAREHILLGLKKALDHIDEIIKIIKKSKDIEDAKLNLMKAFKFSEIQAQTIVDMKIGRLSGLERKKIEDELKEVQALIEFLKDLLSSAKKILGVVKAELQETALKYADERRTKIVKQAIGSMSDEDLIPDTENVLVLTTGGYIKRTNPDEYRKQKRGGVGVVDLDTKDEDFVVNFLTASTHNDILFFSDKGKAYQIKMHELPEGKRATKGKALVNYLSISPEERVTSVLAMPKELKNSKLSLMMVTKQGVAKKVDAKAFHDVRRSGLIAISLHDGDELTSVQFVAPTDEVILATAKGQSIRYKESDIREMGRGAAGVRAVKLGKGDAVVSTDVIKKEMKNPVFFVISSNGYGKNTDLKEYKVQNRGGSGIKKINIGDKVAAKVVDAGNADGYIELSLKEARQALIWDEAEVAIKNKTVLELPVEEANKGGLIISWQGIKGFLPASQLKTEHYPRVSDGDKDKILDELKKLVGQKISVMIITALPKEGKLIFSEKNIEGKKGSTSSKKNVEKYKVGDIAEGTITGIVDFGIFIKIEEGLEGLVHISEIDWTLVEDPRAFYKVGEKVNVKVIEVKDGKVSLSIKALKENPWIEAEKKYKKGDEVKGVVIKFNKHGAIASIEEGISGLVHISEFGSEQKMKEKIELGKSYGFKILLFESKNQKMGLSFVDSAKK